jgi:hypothetical protein
VRPATDIGRVHVSSRQLQRENAELRRRLREWELLAASSLRPFLDRTGGVEVIELSNGLARLASLALDRGLSHAQVIDAVRPDARGAAAG